MLTAQDQIAADEEFQAMLLSLVPSSIVSAVVEELAEEKLDANAQTIFSPLLKWVSVV
jgi:hypothetical protein